MHKSSYLRGIKFFCWCRMADFLSCAQLPFTPQACARLTEVQQSGDPCSTCAQNLCGRTWLHGGRSHAPSCLSHCHYAQGARRWQQTCFGRVHNTRSQGGPAWHTPSHTTLCGHRRTEGVRGIPSRIPLHVGVAGLRGAGAALPGHDRHACARLPREVLAARGPHPR